ncbi:MAG: hypothetical protein ABH822_00725 [Patescibacteria group bacterium]
MKKRLIGVVLFALGFYSMAMAQPPPLEDMEFGDEPPVVAPKPDLEPILSETLVDENTPKRYRVADFYYYTDVGKVNGLPLTNRLMLIFEPQWQKSGKQGEYLERFHEQIAPISNISHENHWVVVELDVNNHSKDHVSYIVRKLTEISVFEEKILKEKVTTALPIVVIGGQDCYPTNEIFIKTKSPITLDLLRQRLQSKTQPVGEFRIAALSAGEEGRTYYLTVADLEWPPNPLVLANLLSEQPWVEFAQVLFQPLDRPIKATLEILPNGSPTLGEKRYLVLTVNIFDPSYKLNVDLLPQLGRGEFMPHNTRSSQMIDQVFFYVEEMQVTEQEERGKRKITVTWPFYVYQPGTYQIPEIEVPYLIRSAAIESVKTLKVIPQFLMVNSVIQNSPQLIEDIQPMRFYSLADVANSPKSAEAEGAIPWWKCDKWLVGVVALSFGWLIVFLVSALFCYRLVKFFKFKLNIWRGRRAILSELRQAARLVRKNGFAGYALAERCLRKVMVEFLGLSYNTSFQEMKLKPKTDLNKYLVDCLEEFEQQCIPGYEPEKDTTSALAFQLRRITQLAKGKGDSDDD